MCGKMVGIEAETRLRRCGRESLTEPHCLFARIGRQQQRHVSASSADMLGRLQHYLVMALRLRALLAVLVLLAPAAARAQAPIEYRLSFPEAEHRLMDVEVRFDEVPAGTLELRMSRSSPGRYALHEFAKNVFDVRVTDEQARRCRWRVRTRISGT